MCNVILQRLSKLQKSVEVALEILFRKVTFSSNVRFTEKFLPKKASEFLIPKLFINIF